MTATRTVKRHEHKDGQRVLPVTPQTDGEAVPAPDNVPTSRRRREELLSFAGIWSDLDGDRMIEEIYAARHESSPSPPVKPSSAVTSTSPVFPASTATGKAR